jgi:tRNA (Thr-GGU) A37 N-methylase
MKRLAALMPAPYSHTIRYYGVFANRSKYRPLWASLMKRVLDVDALPYTVCFQRCNTSLHAIEEI